jgi:predicted nucleotidyltransferase
MDEIKALGLRLAELCQKYGIAELSVFGSVARGDARPDSDVDLLYVLQEMISACPISLCKTTWRNRSAGLLT